MNARITFVAAFFLFALGFAQAQDAKPVSSDFFSVKMAEDKGDAETIAKRKAASLALLAKDELKVKGTVIPSGTGQAKEVVYTAYPKKNDFQFFLDVNMSTLCYRGGVKTTYYVHEDGWLVMELFHEEKNPLWSCEQLMFLYNPLSGKGRTWYAPKGVSINQFQRGRPVTVE